MLLITDLNDIPPFDQACGLTIGSFDGVHLGHQALLNHLRAKLPDEGLVTVLTFSNHPSHIFTPHSPVPLICSPLQKVKHLADAGADIVCLIPFTAEFASTSYKDFLKSLKRHLGFTYLALGVGAALGKHKEGTESQVQQLTDQLNFEVDYLPKYLVNGSPVSSGRVRQLIHSGNFYETAHCLGRPYSLMGSLLTEDSLHFPGLCLPSPGIYPIRLKTSSHTYQGHAHIQKNTPKIQLDIQADPPLLEGEEAEIQFENI